MPYRPNCDDEEYFREMQKDAENFGIGATSESWFEFGHFHVDWESRGEDSADNRAKCLQALFFIFERVRKQAEVLGRPWQSWVVIDPDDSGQDAVYLHTPNPNRQNFPYRFDDVTWGVSTPLLLKDIALPEEYELGESSSAEGKALWVRRRAA